MLGLEMAHVCIEVTANYTAKVWQLSGEAQAEEGGWRREELGGQWLLKDREDGFWETWGSSDLAEAQL